MDVFGDFFGYDPATPEERAEMVGKTLREVKLDYVIKGGNVYLSAEEFSQTFTNVSRLLGLRALLTNDVASLGASNGMSAAAKLINDTASELLRREADAILKTNEV